MDAAIFRSRFEPKSEPFRLDIVGHAAPPRFNASATIARIDIDVDNTLLGLPSCRPDYRGWHPHELCKVVLRQVIDASAKRDEIATAPRHVNIGIVGDRINTDDFAAWRRTLSDGELAKRQAPGANKPMDETPIHPLRLCDEIKNFMQRDAILVVDGQEILNFGRQSIPTFAPGHRLNSGPFGTMGVGLPFGIGAKIAKPDKQVIVVHGDGSFGLNALELDTAVRHNIPILVVISLNGGWTADPQRNKPGRNLGYTRFDKLAEALGCYGEYVERPDEIRPALKRAQQEVDRGSVALVNVKTDDRARATTVTFAQYAT
jgi:thiamine pyrophosphate-dependent acetolactate synthase large subunit-like protein